MMKYTPTICALALSIVLLFVYIRQSIIEHKLYKFKLVFSFILVGFFSLSLGFYDIFYASDVKKIWQYIRDGSVIFGYVVIGIALFLNIDFQTTKTSLDSEFVKCLETDKIFILLDKKEKIREISESFASLAGEDKKKLMGKKFVDFLEQYFVINSINDTTIKMSKLKEYFKVWASEAKKGEKYKREFLISNRTGSDSIVLNLTDIPIFGGDSYKGHLLIGDKDNVSNLLNAERKLNDKTSELSNIKARFTSYLSITDEAVFFYNIDDKYIWGNDSFVSNLNLKGNTIGRAEFEAYIHKDDLAYYSRIIASLTPTNPAYEVKYRFKTGANYKFVVEKGKRIFNKGESDEITGTISLINDVRYQKTDMPILDTLKDEAQMLADIDKLYRDRAPFMVSIFKMTNLPEINDKNGRSIGNMVLEEYVKAIKNKFIDDDLMYRISGLDFVLVITDTRKMNVLQTMLQKGSLTSLTMNYGSLCVDISLNYGIAMHNDSLDAQGIVKCAYRALNTSLLPNYNADYLYYRDIK